MYHFLSRENITFNEYFTSIGPRLAANIDNSEFSYTEYVNRAESRFQFDPVDASQVYKLLQSLSISKATGIDRIPAKVLRLAAPVISWSLASIFNTSIASKTFPIEWKVARVSALHKKGPRNIMDNYRPISILPVISKVFEKMLYNQLIEYLHRENLLTENQFGFRRFHSTASALLDCTNEWLFNMDRGFYNVVVFLDLKKAFDTVNHTILLDKLEAYGIDEDSLNLLSSYLTDRKQTCQIDGKQSDLRKISCGVPQGSILGPLLFLTYINDLPNCLNFTTPRIFADDTSITAFGKTLEDTEIELNNDLINIRNWLTANKLSLNIAKTEYVLIGSRQKLNNVSKQPNVVIGDRPIERVRDCKILGVQIDESLTWEKHIDQIAKKISSGISAIRKLRNFANRDTLVSVYNALIQPHFDYCCEVWDSLGSGLAQRLQKLQNRCARIIMHCKNEAGQSDIALHSLGWITLAERRARIKARLMFKILNNLAPKRLSNALRILMQPQVTII